MKKFIGVELARTGRFDASTGPVTLTIEDFDNVADAYQELKGKVLIPIKLGHDEQNILEQSGLPSAGWVENIRRVGEKLVADLMAVPDAVATLIETGGLRTRSIEAVRNVKLAGKRYKIAITGLALLGAELPAVDSLADISALYASGAALDTLEHDSEAARIICTTTEKMPSASEEHVDDLLEELRSIINKIAATTAGKRGAPRLRQLLSVATDELKRTNKLSNGDDNDMDYAKYRKLLKLPDTATDEEVQAALDAKLTAEPEPTPPVEEPKPTEPTNPDPVDNSVAAQIAAAIKPFKDDFIKAQQQLITLTTDKAKGEVTTSVDEAIKARKFMPASRDGLIKLALADKSAFDELVKTTPANAVLSPERGTTATSDIPSEIEPTEIELTIAAQTGVTREMLVAQKAKEAGINYVPPAKEKVS